MRCSCTRLYLCAAQHALPAHPAHLLAAIIAAIPTAGALPPGRWQPRPPRQEVQRGARRSGGATTGDGSGAAAAGATTAALASGQGA